MNIGGKHVDFNEIDDKVKEHVLAAAREAISGPEKEAKVVGAIVTWLAKLLDLDDGTIEDEAGKALVRFIVRSLVRATYRKLRNSGELA